MSPLAHRRAFIQRSAALVGTSALGFPLIGGAQPKTVKVGILHPVAGALAYSSQQCRERAPMAIGAPSCWCWASWWRPCW